jgi:hypothetical protein
MTLSKAWADNLVVIIPNGQKIVANGPDRIQPNCSPLPRRLPVPVASPTSRKGKPPSCPLIGRCVPREDGEVAR